MMPLWSINNVVFVVMTFPGKLFGAQLPASNSKLYTLWYLCLDETNLKGGAQFTEYFF